MRWRKLLFSFAIIGCTACIGPFQAMAATSSEIQEQIDAYMSDLEASQLKSEELETEISGKQEEVGTLFAEVESLNIEKDSYYQDMKTRMAYFYEEMEGNSFLATLLTSRNFAELINRIQFQQSIYDYDSDQLTEYQILVDDLQDKQEKLDAEIEDLGDLVEEQNILQATLEAVISDKNSELAEAKEEEAAAAAAAAAAEAAAKEAEKRASMDAVEYAMASTEAESPSVEVEESSEAESSSSQTESYQDTSSESADASSAVYESGRTEGGQLTRSKGVVYYNGHRETWYSSRSGGVAGTVNGIPGRYTDSDGIIRDGDGYICVASSDYPKGTVVETSLGTGKVYDWGCASGTIDIYTEW